jgi:hypothetical protein
MNNPRAILVVKAASRDVPHLLVHLLTHPFVAAFRQGPTFLSL